jgi:disulfide bond formation protein DsbB
MDGVDLLSYLVLASNLVLIFLILAFLSEIFFNLGDFWKRYKPIMIKNANYLGFIIALVSTLGSLYLSEIKGFTPCIFCWYQRILMYPLTIIFGASIFWDARDVYKYVLPFSIIGMLMSSYHYYMQLNPNPFASCSAVGFSVSCSDTFVMHFGYITIPFMALTGFTLITFLMLILKQSNKA